MAKHGKTYNYDFVLDTIKVANDVTIECKKHGKFKQRAIRHINGSGCSKCYHENRIKQAADEFIVKSREIHNNKYYSKVEYGGCGVKVKIICLKHGVFEQIPQNMFNNGYRRIWDAGHYKYCWQK